jgi:hypothetical protein
MSKIDRVSFEDGKKVAENFLPDNSIRKNLLKFLSNAIIYANGLRPDNWNLNLDKNGGFIRFNVGQVYCVEIFRTYSLILGLKNILEGEVEGKDLQIEFRGHIGKKRFPSDKLQSVPDCLAKVPDSVGCVVRHENIIKTLPYLEEANRGFIVYAINNTVQLLAMNEAHSTGFIDFLSEFCSTRIPNPVYSISENEFYRNQEAKERTVRKLTMSELEERIRDSCKKIPERVNMSTVKFYRNPYVAEYAKRVANGICQDCNQPAPFVHKLTNEPFLETHHIIPLAEGGPDTIENTIALCPNCHRKRHYG